MNHRRFRIRSRCAVICCGLSLFANMASADRLTATLLSDNTVLYELIVVRVDLHFDDAFLPPEAVNDAYEANRQLGRLRRHLELELREPSGEKMSSALLILEFPRPTEPAHVLTAPGVALLGRADPKTDEFHHWTRLGRFKLMVVDRENGLESNEMSITIQDVPQKELEASRMFRQCGVDALVPLVGEQLRQSKSIELFQRLVGEYPESLYGKYAMVSLALIRWKETFAQHNNKGGAEVWGPVAADLAKATAAFDGWHPLRGQALFELARAQALAGQFPEALRTTQTLCTDFPDGQLGEKARALLSELNRRNAEPAQDNNE
ncbi:MAG: tetratricopeptide repeat protein [Planctomycetes bacterium]|nr:tetratricopeptide repeat protein [Planctomycetota bacterium]